MNTERAGWAEVVRMRRELLDLTQEQLANAASVALKTISNLENGSTVPHRGTLGKIQRALGLSGDLDVAVVQAREGAGLERILRDHGLRVAARPVSTDALDGYLRDLEARIADLEDRVSGLELSDVPATQGDFDLAADDSAGKFAEQEADDTP